MQQKLKILLFYVSHRQTEEIMYSAMFFNKSNWLKEHCDVLVYCNNTKIEECLIEDFTNLFASEDKDYIYTSKNAGYTLGLFEAAYDCYETFFDYDYVILLHPDIYIINDEFLRSEIQRMEDDDIVFSVSSPEIDDTKNTWGYHSNFIIWQPMSVIKDRFARYKEFENNTPKKIHISDMDRDFCAESLTMWIIKDSGLKYNVWFRPMDNHLSYANGILHEHINDTTLEILNAQK